MTTKQQALATVAAKTWKINSTDNAAEFNVNDTLKIILDGQGLFQEIEHVSGNSTRLLTPDNPPADCLLFEGVLVITFNYGGGSSAFRIDFNVSSNPITFNYQRTDGAGQGGTGERGGGE